MIAYSYSSIGKKKYIGKVECQIDPVTSELEGKNVYLTPGHATLIPPLESKEGFDVLFSEENNEWFYEEFKPSREELANIKLEEIRNTIEFKNVESLHEYTKYLYNTGWYVE